MSNRRNANRNSGKFGAGKRKQDEDKDESTTRKKGTKANANKNVSRNAAEVEDTRLNANKTSEPNASKQDEATLSQPIKQTHNPVPVIESNNQAVSATDAPGHALDEATISDDEEGGTRIGDIYIPPPIPPHCSMESTGPRLIITKIINNNFKSYANTVKLGPFHHRFTAIIGPNGSGKSNVIDSLLFVFGYRANKIRCKKVSTLLHNSVNYPNTPSCSVAVHFRQIVDVDDESCKDIPGSEIVIERVAFRDNSSYYTINGRRVQFKAVAKLLKTHHVDLDHNRFLILQGEVESIAMMKAKGQNENETGMLEYLEDIIGTSRYKEPLQKINERVEQLTDERTEKHNRLKISEREMNDLEQPYNEALDYLRLENENTRTKNLRIQKYISEKRKKLEEYTKKQEEVRDELMKHDEISKELETKRKEKEDLERKEIKEFDAVRKKKENIEKDLERASSDFTRVQRTMAAVNKRRKENKVSLEKCEENLETLKKIPEKNEAEIKECETKVEKLTKQKAEADEDLQKNYILVEEQTKPLIEKRTKLETDLLDFKQIFDSAKAEQILLEKELNILKRDETAEANKYSILKTSYDDSLENLKTQKEKFEEIQLKLPEIAQGIKEKEQELVKLNQDEKIKRQQVNALKSQIDEKVTTLRMARSNNKVVDFLIRQKLSGKIPGVLGRLGDLAGIDSKYDVAISTACGRLDNILVEDVRTAQKCIESLRQAGVGRASFLALEKIKHYSKYSGRIETPENTPRLYDLLRVEDERVLPAFYFVLRDTLVADNLEVASRIGFGARRFRIVTVSGDIIETSGTMSGGGRSKIRGKMSSKVQTKTKPDMNSSTNEKALDEMQEQAQNLQSEINFLQEEQGRIERELLQLRAKRVQFENDGRKLSITNKSLEEQLPRVFEQLQIQKKRMDATKSDTVKVNELEKQINEKQKSVEKAKVDTDKLDKKIAATKADIEEIHSNKIKSVQTKIKNLSNQIDKLSKNITKLKVEVSSSERNVQKTEKEIENLNSMIINCQDEITELSEQRQKHDDETVELTKQLEETKEALVNAKSGASVVQKEIKEIEDLEEQQKLKRIEINQKLNTTTNRVNEVKSQIPHWEQQLKPLKLNEIPVDKEPQAPLKTYTEEELNSHTLQDIQYKESVQEELLQKKKPNLSCIDEYIVKRDAYLERVKGLEDITAKRNEMRQLHDDVRKKRYHEFMNGFQIITKKLKEMYQMITQGGDAELELVDSMDPFTEGVSFSVRPPKKTWKNISNLSGGEKTLSSLALVFALHYYKPSPLYFMDEIDAALDFKNISIVAHYIKERTKNAQFIIISLRSNMFELSDLVVGIYKVMDCTDALCFHHKRYSLPDAKQNNETTNSLDSSNANLAVDIDNSVRDTITNDAQLIPCDKDTDAAAANCENETQDSMQT
ncbi:structural maintenance of chromosomes protein 4 [Teleopsis dalmanni]|uniref:structural maintenance of chromosomes protein 4 n=1 Tax=Teleopsis dalmanni TaxID=139649 RepID=UPI0018CE89A4|nr:structural maintenance of chromosomes protein 4 [Teleopsis dalmanni]